MFEESVEKLQPLKNIQNQSLLQISYRWKLTADVTVFLYEVFYNDMTEIKAAKIMLSNGEKNYNAHSDTLEYNHWKHT